MFKSVQFRLIQFGVSAGLALVLTIVTAILPAQAEKRVAPRHR